MKKELEVVAAVIKKDNKYFCAKRKDSGELARKWEFPGGKVEKGETHKATIIREIKEELKTNIKVNCYITTVKHEYQSFKIILHAYLCEVINGDLVLTEHLNSKWLTTSEMAEFDFAEADKPIIAAIKKLEVI